LVVLDFRMIAPAAVARNKSAGLSAQNHREGGCTMNEKSRKKGQNESEACPSGKQSEKKGKEEPGLSRLFSWRAGAWACAPTSSRRVRSAETFAHIARSRRLRHSIEYNGYGFKSMLGSDACGKEGSRGGFEPPHPRKQRASQVVSRRRPASTDA